MKENLKNIILMKVGPYCNYSLEEIISIKQKEEKEVGKYFWGYSGVFCHPKVIQNLISHAGNEPIYVLFVETKSNFIPTKVERFEEYSTDKNSWEKLPKDVLLVGNKKKAHFAITARNLRKVDMFIDLSQYCTLMGMFPNTEQCLDSYFKYRVDKACAIFLPDEKRTSTKIKISYISELVTPNSVFVR